MSDREVRTGFGRASATVEQADERTLEGVQLEHDPYLCEGCGAVGTEPNPEGEMRALNNRHKENCPKRMRPLLADGLTVIDPISGYPNEYARRVKDRLVGDQLYMQLHAQVGHAQAATLTCDAVGHDHRAGMCMRCGQRLSQSYEDA